MPLTPKDLDERIAKARAAGARRGVSGGGPGLDAESYRALGLGWRIGFGFISAVVVGVGLGLLVDRWLGTLPAGLIVLGLAGFAGGIWNVWRTIEADAKKPPRQ